MSKTTMSIKTWKNVAAMMPPWTSMLLRANHGVGKSKIVRQVSAIIRNKLINDIKENHPLFTKDGVVINLMPMREFLRSTNSSEFYPVIDRRLSQMTEGDMVGLPSTDGHVTRFNPPDWFKRACDEPCALFLDELNRATPEVMQAAFQIVLDRELNGWKLHPLTRVYAAINDGATYTVNEMDPALLDRFFAIDLDPTVKEFCTWARDTDPVQGGNLNSMIPDFIESNQKHDGSNWLYPPKNAETGGVHPSPRSWEALNHSLVYAGVMNNPDEELFYHMCMGFVGVEAAIAFRTFCKTYDDQLKGEDVVNDYKNPRVRKKVKKLGQGHMNDVVDMVANYVVKNVDSFTDVQGENIKQFMLDISDELRISLWSKMTSQGIDKMELVKSVHKWCVEIVLNVFGVPMGEAGIGHIPNIPGIFQPPTPTK